MTQLRFSGNVGIMSLGTNDGCASDLVGAAPYCDLPHSNPSLIDLELLSLHSWHQIIWNYPMLLLDRFGP